MEIDFKGKTIVVTGAGQGNFKINTIFLRILFSLNYGLLDNLGIWTLSTGVYM